MSLIRDLEDLIERTGSYKDRELLLEVLIQLKKNNRASTWGFSEEIKFSRR
jgi:hypothetical protein